MPFYRAARRADPYSPSAPTLIARKFDLEREIPEPRVTALLEELLRSPLGKRVGQLIAARLGRPLQPFDIWYSGFQPRGRYSEAELDAITKKRYPTPAAYAADTALLSPGGGATGMSIRVTVPAATGIGVVRVVVAVSPGRVKVNVPASVILVFGVPAFVAPSCVSSTS